MNNMLEKLDIWLHGPKEVDIFKEMEYLTKNSEWITQIGLSIEADLLDGFNPIVRPPHQEYFGLSFEYFGQFSDFIFIQFLIENKNKDVLFYIYKYHEFGSFNPNELEKFLKDCLSWLNSTDIFLKEFKKSGLYLYKNEVKDLLDLIRYKRIKENPEEYLVDNFDSLMQELFLYKKDKNQTVMVAEVRNNNLKKEIVNNDLKSLLRHFKVR